MAFLKTVSVGIGSGQPENACAGAPATALLLGKQCCTDRSGTVTFEVVGYC